MLPILQRAAITAGKTAATIGTGIALNQMAKGAKSGNNDGTAAAPNPTDNRLQLSGTGNQRAHQLATHIAPPEGASSIASGITNQVQGRVNLAHQVTDVASNPSAAMANIGDGLRRVWEGVQAVPQSLQILQGAHNVATGESSLTLGDGARVASAAIRESVSKASDGHSRLNLGRIPEAARKAGDAAYVAATTSKEGGQEVVDAVKQRAQHEAASAAAGLVVKQAVTTGLRIAGGPAGQVLATAIDVTSGVMLGSKIADLADLSNRIGGSDDATSNAAKEEMKSILKEKAQANPPASTPQEKPAPRRAQLHVPPAAIAPPRGINYPAGPSLVDKVKQGLQAQPSLTAIARAFAAHIDEQGQKCEMQQAESRRREALHAEHEAYMAARPGTRQKSGLGNVDPQMLETRTGSFASKTTPSASTESSSGQIPRTNT